MFGDGFSLAVLQRLAVLMERQEQPGAAVVRRKGSIVDKVGSFGRNLWPARGWLAGYLAVKDARWPW